MTVPKPAIHIDNRMRSRPVKHMLPHLPYDYAALEPVVDAQTMRLHHDHHHASYVANLNSAIEECPELQGRSALWLLLHSGDVPQNLRTIVRQNAGGHINHSMFWKAMSPRGHGASKPFGALEVAIDHDFGSFKQFKQRFVEAGEKLFGSGWVWLAKSPLNGGELKIYTTNGHDNPHMNRLFPILLNDVWEHAYYLKYQNRRHKYLSDWWSIVNWDEAASCFDRSAEKRAERDWEDEGGTIEVARL